MSRFVLTKAFYAANAGDQVRRLKAGTTIADSHANAVGADVVCAQLCSKPTIGMEPLDSAAVTALAAVGIIATVGEPAKVGFITGADSVDS